MKISLNIDGEPIIETGQAQLNSRDGVLFGYDEKRMITLTMPMKAIEEDQLRIQVLQREDENTEERT